MINKLKNKLKKIKIIILLLKFFLPYLKDYGRPSYRYLIYRAYNEAIKLNYKSCTIIEFGVGSGKGMKILEKISKNLMNKFNFKINLVGFDSLGLKNLSDYRDVKFKWKENFYTGSEEDFKKFDLAKIYVGDVKDTLIKMKKNKDSPLAGLIFDLNLYTSTMSAFNVFNIDEKYVLPRIDCYFDDSNTIEYIGERLAIKEFNEKNKYKKIAQNPLTYSLDDISGWAFYEFHNFKHSKYNTFTNFNAGKSK